jgi:crotonobetainyl-CoA:carnitine CoA-transferase CaiB-like acyl-CoA transferase
MLGGVFRINGTDGGGAKPAPLLGADTDTVLAEL